MPRLLLTLVLSAAGLAGVLPLWAQEDDTAEASAAQMLYQTYRYDVEQFEFSLVGESQREPLTLDNAPILKWTLADGWQGSVFVWTHEQRPRLIGCVGSGPLSANGYTFFNEFHSLAAVPISSTPLSGSRDWTWAPAGAGVEFRPLTDAPSPAASAAGRLIQMRTLARQFAVTMLDDDEQPWTLRMLPQPIYRYQESREAATDGAIFSWLWTKGTDPEFLLLLEPRMVENALIWHYAPVRFTYRELSLTHNGRTVWEVERYGEQWGPSTLLREPYVTVPIRSRTIEEVQRIAGDRTDAGDER